MFGSNKKDDSKKDDNLKDLEQKIEDLEKKDNNEDSSKNEGDQNNFEAKFNALNDKYLRMVAEFENFKRRSTDEKIQNFNLGGKEVLTSVLPFLDNFQRAIDACNDDLKENEWVKGILAIESNLLSDLEKIGFSKIKAKGEKMDFRKHEALMQDSNTEKDTVAQVLEDGYEYNGQVVRVAKVSVGSK